jgi:hypothetical protein
MARKISDRRPIVLCKHEATKGKSQASKGTEKNLPPFSFRFQKFFEDELHTGSSIYNFVKMSSHGKRNQFFGHDKCGDDHDHRSFQPREKKKPFRAYTTYSQHRLNQLEF